MYEELLDKMIRKFVFYKPGSIALENITKLCQTLGLESFVDQLDSNISRLSIASKIIVIDIDYEVSHEKVKDVKLVLASSFDKFNYFNENENILFNSLTKCEDLSEFYHNLNFLCLLDKCSNIDIENSKAQFDLFKYYTEFPMYLQEYFKDNGFDYVVKTNLNNIFGIYICDVHFVPVMKITFNKSQHSEQRLYEFLYSKENLDWINESPDSFSQGITMVLEWLGDDTYFPMDYIPKEIIYKTTPKDTFTLTCDNDNISVINDFTTDFKLIKEFQICNTNLSLLYDILKWFMWWSKVLNPLFQCLNTTSHNQLGKKRRTSSSSSRNRLSFTKTRRSSVIADTKMLKDERLQEFTLNEILNDPVFQDESINIPKQLIINEDYIFFENLGSCKLYEHWSQWDTFINKVISEIQ